jgi:transposase
MDIVFTHGAGVDVHNKSVTVCRVIPDPTGQSAEGQMEVKAFGTLTIALLGVADWLAEAGITQVAIESTGESWKPVYNLLEANFEVVLVNASHVKQVPGRKTDKADARWLAKLLRHGLLQASDIPPARQRDLRDLTRYRTKLVQERGREVNRVQGVLERANMKLASVVTDVMGISGRAMVDALMAGRADPATMAELARGRLRSKIPVLEQARRGVVRDHQRWWLATQVAHIEFLEAQIDLLGGAIQRCLAALSREESPAPQEGSASDAPATSLTFMRAVEILDTIPGVDQRGAEVVVAEIGVEMGRFGSAKCLAAWAGVAPGNDESAGTQRSGKTRKGNRPLRTALVQLAHAAPRTKRTYLAALFHRLAARRGRKRAIMAVAHSILVSAYHRLSRNEPYHE